MIERWLQITCDGCGETETTDAPDETKAGLRKYMAGYGWRTGRGSRDYCRGCVWLGHHKTGFTIFGGEKKE